MFVLWNLIFKVNSTLLPLSGNAENPRKRRKVGKKNERSAAHASVGPSSIVGDDAGETHIIGLWTRFD